MAIVASGDNSYFVKGLQRILLIEPDKRPMLLGPGMRTQTTSYFARLFAGDLSAFGGPATDEAVAGHIRADQMSLVLGYSVGIMLANACNAAVLAIALWHSPDWKFALAWAAIVGSPPALPRPTFASFRFRNFSLESLDARGRFAGGGGRWVFGDYQPILCHSFLCAA